MAANFFLKTMAAGIAMLLLVAASPVRLYAESEILKDLGLAYDRENSARDKYIAFIDLANREGHKSLASLYRAVAAAKAVQIRNFRALMQAQGATAKSKPEDAPSLYSIKRQLEMALEDEAYKCGTMYPGFLTHAEQVKNADAMLAFYYGKVVSEAHAGLFRDTLERKETWKSQRTDYFICPICGNTVRERPQFSKCPVCGTPAMAYQTVN